MTALIGSSLRQSGAFFRATRGTLPRSIPHLASPLTIQTPHLIRVIPRTSHRIRRQHGLNALRVFSAELYDKLVGFVDDLESLGNRLKQA